jgi:hypothetical protein
MPQQAFFGVAAPPRRSPDLMSTAPQLHNNKGIIHG